MNFAIRVIQVILTLEIEATLMCLNIGTPNNH